MGNAIDFLSGRRWIIHQHSWDTQREYSVRDREREPGSKANRSDFSMTETMRTAGLREKRRNKEGERTFFFLIFGIS